MPTPSPNLRILANAAAAVPELVDEVRALLVRKPRPLLGFATGGTFAAFLQALQVELTNGRIASADNLLATHLDEYLGFPPDRVGGMVHELGTACPYLLHMLARGTFFPVPHDSEASSLRAHEQRLQRAGGVQLQFLGIGRNGHLAFNEPGTPFDSGFHVTTLAETTRDDARARFRPAEPPTHAVTSGLATILAAERLVLCAFGKAKASAVAAMLQGPVGPQCPASVVRTHKNVLVLLDRDAASLLRSGQVGA
jgi:glucosamine-6-phosphate deaminase